MCWKGWLSTIIRTYQHTQNSKGFPSARVIRAPSTIYYQQLHNGHKNNQISAKKWVVLLLEYKIVHPAIICLPKVHTVLLEQQQYTNVLAVCTSRNNKILARRHVLSVCFEKKFHTDVIIRAIHTRTSITSLQILWAQSSLSIFVPKLSS